MASPLTAPRAATRSAPGTTLTGRPFSATPILFPGPPADDPGGPIIDRRHGHADPFAAAVLEPLEARQLMSVGLDADGWTVVAPAADSRVIYVSNTGGDDAAAGLSAAAPVRTLARAVALVRDDSADQILLKRGDAWAETFGVWTKSGRSRQEPILIGAYGAGARPLIKAGVDDGILIGASRAKSVEHLAIVGIHFWADGRDPTVPGYDPKVVSYAVKGVAGGGDILIEDCRAARFMTNVSFVGYFGEVRDVRVRRNVLVDAYDVGATKLHAQGMFADNVSGLLLEGNTFDHNGWADDVPGARPKIYNHNVYLTAETDGVVVRGNTFAHASSHGLQARSGGIVTGNLFLNNPIGMSYGLVNGGGKTKPGGVSGEVSDNVFVGGRTIDGAGRGIGIEVANIRPGTGTVIQRNVFTQYLEGGHPAIELSSGVGIYQGDGVGLNDLTLRDNVVYKWHAGLSVQGGMSPDAAVPYKRLRNVVLRGNEFVELDGRALANADDLDVDRRAGGEGRAALGDRFDHPERTVASYNKTVGGAEANWQFVERARGQSRQDWDKRFTARAAVNYIRDGFGMDPVGGSTTGPTPTPQPPPRVPPSPPPVMPGPNPNPTPTPGQVPDPTPIDETPTVGGPRQHARRRDAAVYVKGLKFSSNHHVQRLIVRFSRDVGGSLDVRDLTLTAADGRAVDVSGAQFSYDAKKRRAVWTLSEDDASTRLARGRYTAGLSAAGVVDANGRQLDGNKDRVGGDDLLKRVRVKR